MDDNPAPPVGIRNGEEIRDGTRVSVESALADGAGPWGMSQIGYRGRISAGRSYS